MDLRPLKFQFFSRVFLLVLFAGTLRVAAQDADHFPGRVVVRIDPAFRAYCGPSSLKIPGLLPVWERLAVTRVGQMFPFLVEPTRSGPVNSLPYVDLSLVYEIDFQASVSVPEAAALLSRHPSVVYAEPLFAQYPVYQPNDELADTTGGRDLMWHLNQVRMREAWDISRGDPDIVIGVVDAGISFEHPDLQANQWTNSADPVDGIDNDGDGYVDDYRGWDFGGDSLSAGSDNDPTYGLDDHGNLVAGIIGATPDNEIGIPGLAYECRYMPIKVGVDDQPGVFYFGYQGLVYAAFKGAKVINCSWGSSAWSQLGQDVIDYATINRQAAVVAAAGNGGVDEAFYPASYARAFSVANSGYGDTLYPRSTYHASVDVVAPGQDIRTTSRNDDYVPFFTGTSASSPIVSAAVGIVLAHFPAFNGFQAAQRLRMTADPVEDENPDKREKLGRGRINVLRALTDPPVPSVRLYDQTFAGSQGDNLRPGDTVTMDGIWVNYLDPTQELTISLSTSEGQGGIEILEGTLRAGQLQTLQGINVPQAFRFRVSNGVKPDQEVFLKLSYSDPATGYEDVEFVPLIVNKSYLDITENAIHTSVNSTGAFGFHTSGEGLGFRYQDGENALFEGGLLIGDGPGRVSDNIRNSGTGRDSEDFRLVEIVDTAASPLADFYARAVFDDAAAFPSLGIGIRQEIFADSDAENQDYVILAYTFDNPLANGLQGLYTGLFADWDISNADSNACDMIWDQRLMYAYDLTGEDPNYYAIAVLSEDGFRAQAAVREDLFNDSTKFLALSQIPNPASTRISGPRDIMFYAATGPFDLPAQGQYQVGFALLAAPSLEALVAASQAARAKYRCVVRGDGPKEDFGFSQTEPPVAGTPIAFSGNNEGATSWQWDFGDGNTSTAQNPAHIFAQPGTYLVTLTVSDEVCTLTLTREITVSTGTGIPSIGQVPFRVYPNPSSGTFVLKADPQEVISSWRVVNLLGQQIVSWQGTPRHSKNTHTLDLRTHQDGWYFLQVSLGEGTFTKSLYLKK